ncbi:signal peptidase II [Lactiplantibacillus fabifermentans]|uniref:Lipoprotein signal peptidase n=2 Tax=Lactiplantibacillus fabifermentans TaxID=483011 RepID=W6T7Y0_9LACO|nr:signal peptidase II [Lactiplantibacillus fabifermentans]ETY74329.1 signal peptidase II [Lactiplantibacillus fabifermentans T30PCM01]
MWIYWVLMFILVVVDQIIKSAIVSHIALGATTTVVPGLLSLTNLHNSGAAWSILQGKLSFFYLISVVALGVMVYLLWRLRDKRLYEFGIVLMIAGTLGNFIDRIRIGYVVDMFQLDFINFPIFNFADACLTFGVILILIAVLKDDSFEK